MVNSDNDKFFRGNEMMEHEYASFNTKMRVLARLLEQKSSIAKMGEIVVSTTEKPIVGTSGLAICNGIIFYDRKNKKAWVGHGPASCTIHILSQMICHLRGLKGTIEYAFIPGYGNGNNPEINNLMLDYLMKNCPTTIKLVQFENLDVQLDSSGPSYEFAFDAKSGLSVTKYLFYKPFEFELNSKKK